MKQESDKLNKLLIEKHILLFILGLMYGYLLMFPLVGFKIDLTKDYYMSVFVGYIALISLLVYIFAGKLSKSIGYVIKQFQNEYITSGLNIALTELKMWEEELKKRLKKYEKRFKSKRTTNHKSCSMVAELNTILKELKKIQKKLKV